MRPIVNDPKFNEMLYLMKPVGPPGTKPISMNVTMSKNFFLAGEMVYLGINIDNTACGVPCSLIVAQKSDLWLEFTGDRCYNSEVKTHRAENFYLCGPGECRQFFV